MIIMRDVSEIDLEDPSPADFFHSYLYEVISVEDNDEEEVIGRVTAYTFDFLEVAEIDLLGAADEVSGSLLKMAKFFFDGKRGALNEDADWCSITRLLVIDSVQIQRPHRGKDLGHRVVAALWARLGKPHVALMPAPIAEDEGKGRQKLWAYWSRLGFNTQNRRANILWNNSGLVSAFPQL
jgi:GNAT superfamily N-acetyltransferase